VTSHYITLHGKGSTCCGNSDSTFNGIISLSPALAGKFLCLETAYYLRYVVGSWKLGVPLIMNIHISELAAAQMFCILSVAKFVSFLQWTWLNEAQASVLKSLIWLLHVVCC